MTDNITDQNSTATELSDEQKLKLENLTIKDSCM